MASLESIVRNVSRFVAAGAIAAAISCSSPEKDLHIITSCYADGMKAYEEGDYQTASKLLRKGWLASRDNPLLAVNYARSMEKEWGGQYFWYATYVRKQAADLLADYIKDNKNRWACEIRHSRQKEALETLKEAYINIRLQTENLTELKEYCKRFKRYDDYYDADYALEKHKENIKFFDGMCKEAVKKEE